MLVLLAAVVTGAWADGIVCTARDLGKVLCTDGSIYENVSAATTAGKTAAAVIVYVDETSKKGLAIALADEGTMNWSTAKSTCEGKTAITGVKWCLPSQNQWEQMFQANGGTTAENTVLNTTITTAGGKPLKENATYWSSSEKSPGVSACTVVLISDIVGWGNMTEDNAYQVRACLAFAPPTYAVKMADAETEAENANWTIASGSKSVKGSVADGLTGLEEGDAVTLTYSGRLKVKGVKAISDAQPAEGHALAESAVGELVGSDGKAYAAADKDNLPSGETAVAMVCSISRGHGLALALADEGQMNCSTAISTCQGKTPTVTGCTWKLATKDEWDNMISGAGGYAALRDGFTSVGGTNLKSNWYWSSTKYNDSYTYEYFFGEGRQSNWSWANKNTSIYVRAALAF